MLRIGLIGCGTHANWAVVPALKGAADMVEFVAACDINQANVDKIEAPGIQRFTDHRKMIKEAKLDAVYIATLPDTHAAIAIDALNAGLHTLIEKPMASTSGECDAILTTATRAGKQVAVNFELRYHTEMVRVREWIRSGHLGRVRAMHIQNFWDGHKVFGDIGARRKRLANLAGTLDCGVHKADLARYFLDGPSWSSVTSRGRWFGEDTAYPTHSSVLAELSSGTLVTLNASFAYGAFSQNFKAYSDVWTIVGDKGVINMFEDRIQPTIMRLHSETLTDQIDVGHQSHASVMVDTCRDFARLCATGKTPEKLATGLDGLQSQIFVDRANNDSVRHRVD